MANARVLCSSHCGDRRSFFSEMTAILKTGVSVSAPLQQIE